MSPATKLVAVILTKNEAAHIADCIATLRDWVQLVVVWDSGSDDATCTLACQAGAAVVQRPFDTYAAQRQAVLDTINAEWILFVDADERATPELATEICARLAEDASAVDGYWIPRRNFIAGHETRGGGYYPDYQLRLLRRTAAHYAPRAVHEIALVEGDTAHLQAPLRKSWPNAASGRAPTTLCCSRCASSAAATSPSRAIRTGCTGCGLPPGSPGTMALCHTGIF